MLGRSHDGIAFPAVLLAFASLGTPAMGATTDSDPALAEPSVTVLDGGGAEDAVDESGLSTAFALVAPMEDVVRRESGEPLPFETKASDADAPVAHAGVGDVPVVDAHSERDVAVGDLKDAAPREVDGESVALWTVADTVTLDQRLLRNLRGDFVARLERVADRMWNEHGMRVEVVEGYRTPQRQQALFAQGRTAEGPVVTWTRNSLHSAGAAADLFVDGSPVTPETAALLSRVAREEGLRTLHPFDSGHIQMEGVARRGSPESALPRELPGSPVGEPQPKGVAPVAPVAAPARPARPGGLVLNDLSGSVSEVRPDVSAEGPGEGVRAAPKQSPAEVVRALLASADGSLGRQLRNGVGGGSEGEGQPTRPNGDGLGRPGAKVAVGEIPTGRSTLAADAEPGLSALQPDRTGGATEAKTGPMSRTATPAMEPTAQMARIESAQGTVFRRVHVPIDGLGGPASLNLGIRGGTVDASLTVSDPILATDLRENLIELRQSLASRGIETAGMAIRVAPEGARPVSSAVDLMATTAAEAGGTNASSEGRSGDSKHQSSRNGHPHFTDDHDDGPTPRRRDGRPDRNAEEQ